MPEELKKGMINYISKAMKDFPEEIVGLVVTAMVNHLFKVRDDSEQRILPEEQAVVFYHAIPQLLFTSAKARRDVQTAVAFLTT